MSFSARDLDAPNSRPQYSSYSLSLLPPEYSFAGEMLRCWVGVGIEHVVETDVGVEAVVRYQGFVLLLYCFVPVLSVR